MAKDAPDNRPLHTVRHRSLKATIWRNGTEKGDLYNVVITRSYRDKETQEWRDTHSIGYDDLMNVAALMYEAHSYISGLKAKSQLGSKPATKARHARTPARPAPSTAAGKELPF